MVEPERALYDVSGSSPSRAGDSADLPAGAGSIMLRFGDWWVSRRFPLWVMNRSRLRTLGLITLIGIAMVAVSLAGSLPSRLQQPDSQTVLWRGGS